MKIFTSLLTIVSLGQGICMAQPVLITSVDFRGNLGWTNHICTTAPVYEILQASAIDGPWNHLDFVTNETSASVAGALGGSDGPVFFKIAWVDEPELVFNYAFSEFGFGLETASVTGQLNLSFTKRGTRDFVPTEFYDFDNSLHPIGQAALASPARSSDGTALRVYLTLGFSAESAIYLDGTLEHSIVDGRCVYTACGGTVYFVGIQTEAIGIFAGTRRP